MKVKFVFCLPPTADYTYGNHGGWGAAPYPQHQNMTSQGHFSERYGPALSSSSSFSSSRSHTVSVRRGSRVTAAVSSSLPIPAQDREQLKMELQQVNQQINQQTQVRSMEVCMMRALARVLSLLCSPKPRFPVSRNAQAEPMETSRSLLHPLIMGSNEM